MEGTRSVIPFWCPIESQNKCNFSVSSMSPPSGDFSAKMV